MNIERKLELIDSSIRSISGHADEDAAVRLAALDQVEAIVARERGVIDAAVQERIAGFGAKE